MQRFKSAASGKCLLNITPVHSNFKTFGRAAAPARTARSDPPERAMGRRWLAAAATALVTAYVAQAVVPAAETSRVPIVGIAPSYGPKTVSAVPNAAAIVRRIWLPELDAGYDAQGLAVDDGAIYVSAYRSDSLGVLRRRTSGTEWLSTRMPERA